MVGLDLSLADSQVPRHCLFVWLVSVAVALCLANLSRPDLA